jgi:hypothetical protein
MDIPLYPNLGILAQCLQGMVGDFHPQYHKALLQAVGHKPIVPPHDSSSLLDVPSRSLFSFRLRGPTGARYEFLLAGRSLN